MTKRFAYDRIDLGGILPVFLEICELPADVDGALNATKDDLIVAVNECAQSLNVIPFGLAHANVKIGPLQFGWYSCSKVVIKKADKVRKCINCPLRILLLHLSFSFLFFFSSFSASDTSF